jgi:hypothetical protein
LNFEVQFFFKNLRGGGAGQNAGMTLQNVLSSWNINTKRISDINDIRMRFLPTVVEKKLNGNLIEFENSNGNEKYRVKYRSLISKGSNGKIYVGYRSTNRGAGYTPLIVKKIKCSLNALRECAVQAMVYDSIPNHCPRIYNVFRSKNNLWVFMQDLRISTSSKVHACTLFQWFNWMSTSFMGNKAQAIKDIIGRILSMLGDLQQKHMFKHGDLHIGNIYIHSSLDEIKNVYLLDFGYSMIKDTGEHSSSPYWLEYKDGVDCAILLWSLNRIPLFTENVSRDIHNWISQKLILADGFDLRKLESSGNLYQKIDSLSLDELSPLRTETISREFFFL